MSLIMSLKPHENSQAWEIDNLNLWSSIHPCLWETPRDILPYNYMRATSTFCLLPGVSLFIYLHTHTEN